VSFGLGAVLASCNSNSARSASLALDRRRHRSRARSKRRCRRCRWCCEATSSMSSAGSVSGKRTTRSASLLRHSRCWHTRSRSSSRRVSRRMPAIRWLPVHRPLLLVRVWPRVSMPLTFTDSGVVQQQQQVILPRHSNHQPLQSMQRTRLLS